MHLSSENIHFSTITGATCAVYKLLMIGQTKQKGNNSNNSCSPKNKGAD